MLDTHVKTIDGEEKTLRSFGAKAFLIVNVASKCGYTPQYEGLEALYQKYKGKGLVLLGFPSNDFGGQEPGTEAEIKQFCKMRYGVTFPLSAKVKVKGDDKTPLYKELTKTGGEVKWNFTKFLVDRTGKVVNRFDSGVEPNAAELAQAIESALK